jgi:hypothetical protein
MGFNVEAILFVSEDLEKKFRRIIASGRDNLMRITVWNSRVNLIAFCDNTI